MAVTSIDSMSIVEKARLIFSPGVSTSSSVSRISGRGVGMDAVKGFLEAKGGSIEIEFLSQEISGQTIPFKFLITLPMTSQKVPFKKVS